MFSFAINAAILPFSLTVGILATDAGSGGDPVFMKGLLFIQAYHYLYKPTISYTSERYYLVF